MFNIYSKPHCPNCDKAKAYLDSKGIPYQEFKLDVGQVKEDGVSYFTVEALQKLVPGARTVPQIFQKTGDEAVLIGGWEALKRHLA